MTNLSIIIPHHYGTIIHDCLKSISQVHCEKIVVTSSWIFWAENKHKDVKVLWTGWNNPAFKRNNAAKYSKGEYILFLDDDCLPSIECIELLYQYLSTHNDVGMVYACLSGGDNHAGAYLTASGFLYEQPFNGDIANPKPYPILSGKSACGMVRRSVFEKVGGFNNDYVIYCEETDLSWRIWEAGYMVVMLPQAVCNHISDRKPKEYYDTRKIAYHGTKNYISMLLSHLPFRYWWILPIHLFLWVIIALGKLLQGQPDYARHIIYGIGYNLKRWPKRSKSHVRYWHHIYKNPPLRYYVQRIREYFRQ